MANDNTGEAREYQLREHLNSLDETICEKCQKEIKYSNNEVFETYDEMEEKQLGEICYNCYDEIQDSNIAFEENLEIK